MKPEPAFPTDSAHESKKGVFHHEGMSLRDYFAAKAMQGSLSNSDEVFDHKKFAKWCYMIADEMMAARDE